MWLKTLSCAAAVAVVTRLPRNPSSMYHGWDSMAHDDCLPYSCFLFRSLSLFDIFLRSISLLLTRTLARSPVCSFVVVIILFHFRLAFEWTWSECILWSYINIMYSCLMRHDVNALCMQQRRVSVDEYQVTSARARPSTRAREQTKIKHANIKMKNNTSFSRYDSECMLSIWPGTCCWNERQGSKRTLNAINAVNRGKWNEEWASARNGDHGAYRVERRRRPEQMNKWMLPS